MLAPACHNHLLRDHELSSRRWTCRPAFLAVLRAAQSPPVAAAESCLQAGTQAPPPPCSAATSADLSAAVFPASDFTSNSPCKRSVGKG